MIARQQVRRLAVVVRLLACTLWIGMLPGEPSARAEVSPARLEVLQRGINVSHWFRFPPRAAPSAMRDYLPGEVLRRLRAAGFTFVRLPVQPEVFEGASVVSADPIAALRSAIGRIQAAGLAVLIAPDLHGWQLETEASDRTRLFGFWHTLGKAIAEFNRDRTFPEIVNEPVFHADPDGWARLQSAVLSELRTMLPDATVVLTGNDWGGLDGLLRLTPVADANVVYDVHFYEPPLLTSLGAFDPGLNADVLSRLPFPVSDRASCETQALSPQTPARTAPAARYYCAEAWDAARIAGRLRLAGDWARRNRRAVVMSEFGATARLLPSSRLAWLSAVRTAAEREGIGWAVWAYDDPMAFGVSPTTPMAASLDHAVLQALGLQ